jgi:hypothetical protein
LNLGLGRNAGPRVAAEELSSKSYRQKNCLRIMDNFP